MIFFCILYLCLPTNYPTDFQEYCNDELLRKLFYSLKDYARVSVVRGNVHKGTPAIGGRVSEDYFCSAFKDTYLIFEFPEAPVLNDITFHLWDYDDRIYTYSIDVFSNGEWLNIVDNVNGRGIQYIHFNDVEKVKAIRMKGFNTVNPHFHILNDWLSFRYKL